VNVFSTFRRPFLLLLLLFFFSSSFFFPSSSSSYSSSLGPVTLCPGCTSALGLLCNPKYSTQYRLNNPVPLIKRQRSLTEAVLIFRRPLLLPHLRLRRDRPNQQTHGAVCTTRRQYDPPTAKRT